MTGINDTLWIVAPVVALVFIAPIISPVMATTISGTAQVEIRQPVTIAQTSPLNFGIIHSDSADVITLTPAGTIAAQNGSTIVAGSTNASQFTVAGTANAAMTISLTNGILTGTGSDMPLNNLQHNVAGTPRFAGDGTLTFSVGGDLVIGDEQTPGIYSGTYSLSVDYQ